MCVFTNDDQTKELPKANANWQGERKRRRRRQRVYINWEHTGERCSNRKGNESIELPFSAFVELNPSFSCSRLLLVCLMSQRQKQQQQLSNYLSYQLRRRGRENRRIEAAAAIESSARILLLADFWLQVLLSTVKPLEPLWRFCCCCYWKRTKRCFGYILSTLEAWSLASGSSHHQPQL